MFRVKALHPVAFWKTSLTRVFREKCSKTLALCVDYLNADKMAAEPWSLEVKQIFEKFKQNPKTMKTKEKKTSGLETSTAADQRNLARSDSSWKAYNWLVAAEPRTEPIANQMVMNNDMKCKYIYTSWTFSSFFMQQPQILMCFIEMLLATHNFEIEEKLILLHLSQNLYTKSLKRCTSTKALNWIYLWTLTGPFNTWLRLDWNQPIRLPAVWLCCRAAGWTFAPISIQKYSIDPKWKWNK